MSPDTVAKILDPFFATKFIGRGLAGFVQKPFDFDLISSEVRRAFSGQ